MSKRATIQTMLACTMLAAAGSATAIAETSGVTSIAYRVSGAVTVELFGEANGIAVFNGLNPSSDTISATFGGGALLNGSAALAEAKIKTQGALIVVSGGEAEPLMIDNPIVTLDGTGDGQILSSRLEDFTGYFNLPASLRTAQIDANGRMQVVNGITISPELAEYLGVPQAAGQVVGQITIDMDDRQDLSRANPDMVGVDDLPAAPANPERICANPTSGPDVIVGDLNGISNYGPVGSIKAFSIGTTSCNLGNVNLQWIQSTNRHPVIPQNLYKFFPATVGGTNGNTRMWQIGQSFLKHGFFALSETLCCACNGTDGTALGTGCSDPYTAARNGTQSNIGPRWEVNTTTGWYNYPWSAPAAAATIGRRLQVDTADLSSQPTGTKFFGECQYVCADESTFGALMNDNNNASHRQVTIGSSSPFTGTLTSTTQRQRPAILAWQDNDNTVGVSIIDHAPGGVHDGRYYLAYDTTALGGGQWEYQYALYNLNGGRGIGSFRVPLPDGAVLSSVSFHDVLRHSGDGVNDVQRDGTDWTPTIDSTPGNGSITWATSLCTANDNANQLNWGLMFNFSFVCNLPPHKVDVFMNTFRGNGPYKNQNPGAANDCGTGGPVTISAAANIPGADCNGNGIADSIDIGAGTSQDLNMNGVPDECEFAPNEGCCFSDGTCSDLPPSSCTASGGTPQGPGSTCATANCPQPCPSDLDGDGSVGLSDVAAILLRWGEAGGAEDLDGDGSVGLGDVAQVLLEWGPCP